MSAREVLVASAVAALRRAIERVAVFDAPPVRASVPYAVVGDPVLGEADAVGVEGVEGRLTITLRDRGERPVRLRALVADAEGAMARMPRDLGEGWALTAMRLVKAGLARSGPDDWSATSEFAVRLFRQGDE